MASRDQETRERQKAQWERKLAERVAHLTDQGLAEKAIARDAAVKMLKANIKQSAARLRAIAAMAQKQEEKARAKAEKLAMPKEEKARKKVAVEEESLEESKRQQKKKLKKEKKEAGAEEQAG